MPSQNFLAPSQLGLGSHRQWQPARSALPASWNTPQFSQKAGQMASCHRLHHCSRLQKSSAGRNPCLGHEGCMKILLMCTGASFGRCQARDMRLSRHSAYREPICKWNQATEAQTCLTEKGCELYLKPLSDCNALLSHRLGSIGLSGLVHDLHHLILQVDCLVEV